jgi:hypothetical protein
LFTLSNYWNGFIKQIERTAAPIKLSGFESKNEFNNKKDSWKKSTKNLPSNFDSKNFGKSLFHVEAYENSIQNSQLSRKQIKTLIRNQKAADKLFNQVPGTIQVIFALQNQILEVLILLIHFLF